MRKYWLLFVIMTLFSSKLFGEESKVRDPFQTNVSQPPVSPHPQVNEAANLEGISIGSAGAFTVINGEVYHEGESKSGIKVTKIRKKEVDIVINDVSQTLQMIPGKKRSVTTQEDTK